MCENTSSLISCDNFAEVADSFVVKIGTRGVWANAFVTNWNYALMYKMVPWEHWRHVVIDPYTPRLLHSHWGNRMTLEMACRTWPLQSVLGGGPVTPTPIREYNGLRGERLEISLLNTSLEMTTVRLQHYLPWANELTTKGGITK